MVEDAHVDNRVAAGDPGEAERVAEARVVRLEEGARGVRVAEGADLLRGGAQVAAVRLGLREEPGAAEPRRVDGRARAERAVGGLEAIAVEPEGAHAAAKRRPRAGRALVKTRDEEAHVDAERVVVADRHAPRPPPRHQVEVAAARHELGARGARDAGRVEAPAGHVVHPPRARVVERAPLEAGDAQAALGAQGGGRCARAAHSDNHDVQLVVHGRAP